jgi:AraC-like DNA-binding protein/mannose-6-phosphate isomerase-like protein (cupin superfamily)
MDFSFLDREEYSEIPVLKMVDNKHGNLPFFIRRYSTNSLKATIHRHEYMQINYIYRGKGRHCIKSHDFDIIKGDIFVIPPFVPHCINAVWDSELEVFEFEFLPDFINQDFSNIENAEAFLDFAYIEPFLVSENQVKPRFNISGKIQVEVESILNEALREYNERNTGFLLLVKSLLLKLLVIAGREFRSDMENSEAGEVYVRHKDSIYAALKYINEHYSEELNVEDTAKNFALSQSYFSYLFKSITSNTFTEYVNSIRISKAMELLKNTDGKVLDICYDVGFNNVNHFNRVFRQQTGVSPRDFRKMERKGLPEG